MPEQREEGEMAARVIEGGTIRDRLTRRHEDYWNRKSCASELRCRMGEVWGAILGVHRWSVVRDEWTRKH